MVAPQATSASYAVHPALRCVPQLRVGRYAPNAGSS